MIYISCLHKVYHAFVGRKVSYVIVCYDSSPDVFKPLALKNVEFALAYNEALWISSKVVEIQSEPGKRSTFKLLLSGPI